MKYDAFQKYIVGLIVALSTLSSRLINGQGVILTSSYDGTNDDGSTYTVGSYPGGLEFAWGASFTAAGSGDYELNEVILPLTVWTLEPSPNLANYQISVVSDVGGQPIGNIVGSYAPGKVDAVNANYTFDITGLVQSGANYWLLYLPVAPDAGTIWWNFAYAPQYPGIGYLAERSSSTGIPTGPWTISTGSGSVQPAFTIEAPLFLSQAAKLCWVLARLDSRFMVVRAENSFTFPGHLET